MFKNKGDKRMEKLLENMYCFEDEDFGFKVKNLSEKEQNRIYKKIKEMQQQDIEITDDKFTFELFKELIKCDKDINFKTMPFEQFEILINSDLVNEVFEQLCYYVGMWYTRIMRNSMRKEILELQGQRLELLKNHVQIIGQKLILETQDITRVERAIKKLEKNIETFKKGDFSEIEKSSKWISKIKGLKRNK